MYPLRQRRDKLNGPRLSRGQTACGQCGGRKLRKHQRCAGQGGRDVLQFLRAGVHDVDADANPLATFEDQIAVVVQYGGLKRKRGSSGGGRSTRRGNGDRNGRWCGCRRRRRRCHRCSGGSRRRAGGRELATGGFGHFVSKLPSRPLNEVIHEEVAVLLKRTTRSTTTLA